jgi:hypothetical protein
MYALNIGLLSLLLEPPHGVGEVDHGVPTLGARTQRCQFFDHERLPYAHDNGNAVIIARAEERGEMVDSLAWTSLTPIHRGGGEDVFVDSGLDSATATLHGHRGRRLELRHVPWHFIPWHFVDVALLSRLSRRGHLFVSTRSASTRRDVPGEAERQGFESWRLIAAEQRRKPPHGMSVSDDGVGESWCIGPHGPELREIWFLDGSGRLESWVTIAPEPGRDPMNLEHTPDCDGPPCAARREAYLTGTIRDSHDEWTQSTRPFLLRMGVPLDNPFPADGYPWESVAEGLRTLSYPHDLNQFWTRLDGFDGKWRSFDFQYRQDGSTRVESVRDGVLHGVAIEFSPDWRVLARERWFDGLPDGSWWALSPDARHVWAAFFWSGRFEFDDFGPISIE